MKRAHIITLVVLVLLGLVGVVAFKVQGRFIIEAQADNSAPVTANVVAVPAPPVTGDVDVMTEDKCNGFTITTETDKELAIFTLSPDAEGQKYNWRVNAGMIKRGAGTASIRVFVPNKGEEVTATLIITGLDASCPTEGVTLTSTVKMPG